MRKINELKPFISDVRGVWDCLVQPVAERHRLPPSAVDELSVDTFVYAVDGYNDEPVLKKAIAIMDTAEEARPGDKNTNWNGFWNEVFDFFSMRKEFSYGYVVYNRF